MSPALPYLLPTRVLNALLAREPWARERLRPHAGKRVRLKVGGLDATLHIDLHGGVRHSGSHDEANVTLTVKAADLPRLMGASPDERMHVVHIEGEAALAHVVSGLARDLRWDVEDELADLIGDVAARRVVETGETLLAGARNTGNRLARNAVEYATYEAGILVDRPTFGQWANEVERLKRDADSLIARATALRRNKAAQ